MGALGAALCIFLGGERRGMIRDHHRDASRGTSTRREVQDHVRTRFPSANQKGQKHVTQIDPLIELPHVTTGRGVGV